MLTTTMLYVQIKLVGKKTETASSDSILDKHAIISTKFKGEITLIGIWQELSHKSKCQTSKIHDLMLKLEQLMSVKSSELFHFNAVYECVKHFQTPFKIFQYKPLCAAAIVHVEKLVDNPDPSSH